MHQNETSYAKHGGVTKLNFGKNQPRRNCTTIRIKKRLRLRIRSDESIRRNKLTMRIR